MSKRIFYILFSIIFCCSFTTLSAQINLSGAIKNSKDQAPISDVIIFDQNSNQLVESNPSGQFTLKALKEGMHQIVFMALGFETINLSINLDQDTFINITIQESMIELSSIEISALRKEFFTLKQLKDYQGTEIYAGKKSEVINLELIEGNLASNNSRQVFSQIAGLNIYEGSDGGIQLSIGGRGLDPNRTSNFNTRQNGYDISADVLGYPENYYTPPAESLDEIQVIRGASSLQYGTQFGGLINFKTKKISRSKKLEFETKQTTGSFAFLNTFNRAAFNYKKWTFNGFYNYKQGNGYRANSEFNVNNLFLNLSYKLNETSTLSADYTYYNYLAKQAGGLTDKMFEESPRSSTRDRNWFAVNWSLFNLKYENNLSESSKLSISLFGLNAFRNSVGFRGNPIELNQNPITALDEQDAQGNYILPRDLIKGNFLNIGLESKYLFEYSVLSKKSIGLVGMKLFRSNNTSFQGPGSTGIDADFTPQNTRFPDYANQSDFVFPNTNIAAFTEQIFYINDKLSITPGLRLEYIRTKGEGSYNQVIFDNANNPIANIEIDEDQVLPRYFALAGLGLSYKHNKVMNWFANLSQNYRSVTFSDIRVVSPTFIVDPSIKDETGYTLDIGLTGRWEKKISYNIGYYNIYYNDRIGVILDDKANRVRKNIGSALISGMESLVDFNLKEILFSNKDHYKLNWFANTALTFSQYLNSEENNVIGKQVEFIPLLNIKSGFQAGYKDLLLSLQYGYVSSQFTDVQNSEAAQDGDNRSGIIGEIPSYQIFDLSLRYNYKQVGIETGINNLLNESYFTRRATGYPGPGIIPSEGRTLYFTISYLFSK